MLPQSWAGAEPSEPREFFIFLPCVDFLGIINIKIIIVIVITVGFLLSHVLFFQMFFFFFHLPHAQRQLYLPRLHQELKSQTRDSKASPKEDQVGKEWNKDKHPSGAALRCMAFGKVFESHLTKLNECKITAHTHTYQ